MAATTSLSAFLAAQLIGDLIAESTLPLLTDLSLDRGGFAVA
jgi:hypothetical protein